MIANECIPPPRVADQRAKQRVMRVRGEFAKCGREGAGGCLHGVSRCCAPWSRPAEDMRKLRRFADGFGGRKSRRILRLGQHASPVEQFRCGPGTDLARVENRQRTRPMLRTAPELVRNWCEKDAAVGTRPKDGTSWVPSAARDSLIRTSPRRFLAHTSFQPVRVGEPRLCPGRSNVPVGVSMRCPTDLHAGKAHEMLQHLPCPAAEWAGVERVNPGNSLQRPTLRCAKTAPIPRCCVSRQNAVRGAIA